jgi:hypothetical protein
MKKIVVVSLILFSLVSCLNLIPSENQKQTDWDPWIVYPKGYYAREFGVIYQSSQDNNQGHEPLISPTWWSRV